MIFKQTIRYLLLIIIINTIASCTRKLYNSQQPGPGKPASVTRPANSSGMEGSIWYPSPNFGTIKTPPLVILHHTATKLLDPSLRTLTSPKSQVSSHYLVTKDGIIYQLVDEQHRAWHAGIGSWNTIRDLNSSSIGIEIINRGYEPFPQEQIQALKVLLSDIKRRYRIPSRNFIGHLDVAPGRKTDPSHYFPWEELSKEGYGLWSDEGEVNNKTTYLPVFDPVWAFAILGYDTANIKLTIKAFKQHYLRQSTKSINTILDDKCYRILYSLVKKALSIPTVITGPQNVEPLPDLDFNNENNNSSKDDNYPELQKQATEYAPSSQ
ncbi:MAG: N-acetylmuramoyl-L-alanine amidase [Solitalea-like symbiont of Acarus siro]